MFNLFGFRNDVQILHSSMSFISWTSNSLPDMSEELKESIEWVQLICRLLICVTDNIFLINLSYILYKLIKTTRDNYDKIVLLRQTCILESKQGFIWIKCYQEMTVLNCRLEFHRHLFHDYITGRIISYTNSYW